MSNAMTPFGLSGALVGISSLCFGIWVAVSSSNKRLGKVWFLFSLAVSVWGVGGCSISLAKTNEAGLLAWQLAYGLGVIWIGVFFYHFICVFLDRPTGRALIVHYLIALVFLLLVPTHLFFSEAKWFFDSFYYAQGGVLYPIFFLWWGGLVIYSHRLLILKYRSSSHEKRNQIKYFFLATAIGFGGGSLAYLPNFGWEIYPWGNFLVALYPLIMTYAILEHRLMDFPFVLRKTFVYTIATLTLTALYLLLINLVSRGLEKWVGPTSTYSSAFAAFVVVLLARPLQQRLQRWMDRQFPRDSLGQALIREVTGGFAHEIKRPLASISMPAELVLADLTRLHAAGQLSESDFLRMRDKLAFVLKQTHEAADKIEAIRGLSIDATKPVTAVHLASVMNEVLKEEASRIEKEQIRLELHLDPSSVEVQGDGSQLKIAFANIVRNAIDAMRDADSKTRLLICTLRWSSDQLQVIVSDTGGGIPEKDLSRLFDPWFSTKGPQGMGIGLYIAQQIIQRHGAEIVVESRVGEGTTFKLGPFSPR